MDKDFFYNELERCLTCKVKPCAKGCPLGVSPCDFIAAAKQKNYTQAAASIAAVNPLPLVCGLICPDHFCQKMCVRAKAGGAINIPHLQAEVMRQGPALPLSLPPKLNKKAAIVGGGPAGLGALFQLITHGWQVDLFESKERLGGAARLIPAYRLPKETYDAEIERLVSNDRVTVYLNHPITDFNALHRSYDGVILALGEPEPRTLGIRGEEHCVGYQTYLSSPEQYRGQKAAVSGGGEVALDCALTLKKQGFSVVEMFVRRQQSNMRIMARDFRELASHDVCIRDLTSITAIEQTTQGYTLQLIQNEINNEGKAQSVAGTESISSGYDLVVTALGSTYPKDKLPQGFILAGDMTGTAGTAVQALASGKAAADKLIQGE